MKSSETQLCFPFKLLQLMLLSRVLYSMWEQSDLLEET